MEESPEQAACRPVVLDADKFNPNVILPYGLTTGQLGRAMEDFLDFLGFIDQQLNSRNLARLESLLMSASFSSLVSEYMVSAIEKYCPTLTKNRYHNGYPDLVPTGCFAGDMAQHGEAGMEVKASRYKSGWQGHNAETGWIMIFQFASNRPGDPGKGISPFPFRFIKVVAAKLDASDWTFAGRSATSRRTITASINPIGFAKLSQNWVYQST